MVNYCEQLFSFQTACSHLGFELPNDILRVVYGRPAICCKSETRNILFALFFKRCWMEVDFPRLDTCPWNVLDF